MKTILFIILLFNFLIVNSQTVENKSKNKKPSWSEDMPEREDVPDFKLDNDNDNGEEDTDMDLRRKGMFDDDSETETDEGETTTEQDDLNNDLEHKQQAKAAAEQQRLADEEKLQAEAVAEAQRLADIVAEEKRQTEAAAEAQRLADIVAEEKLQAEATAKEQRIADVAAEELKLADIAAEEKRQAEAAAEEKKQTEAVSEEQRLEDVATEQKKLNDEKLAAEKSDNPNILQTDSVEDEKLEEVIATPKQQPSKYVWKKLKNVLPEYPSKAARDNKSGWVEVEIVIGSDGKVVAAHFVRSYRNYKVFTKSALKAVRKWKYEPPSNQGIMENQSKTVRIVFKL